jgi:hypothetical protein
MSFFARSTSAEIAMVLSVTLFAGCSDHPSAYRGDWATDDNAYGLKLSVEEGKSRALYRTPNKFREGGWWQNTRGAGYYVSLKDDSGALVVLLRDGGVLDVRPAHEMGGKAVQMKRVVDAFPGVR